MTAYAFWNNKGGVGKSFLSFVAATEYARTYPNTDVYVIDLCPQANLSVRVFCTITSSINLHNLSESHTDASQSSNR